MDQIGKKLEVLYPELFKEVSTLNIQEEARKLIEKNDYKDKSQWLRGLALSDYAVRNNQITQEIKELYLQLYRKHWNLYFSSSLAEEDYNYWLELVQQINNALIEAGHARAYVEGQYILENARRPHRNKEKEKEYLMQGIEHGDPASMAIHGYNLYFGMKGEEENPEEGMKLIQKAKEIGYDYADGFLLNIAYYTEEDNAKIEEAINKAIEEEEETEKPYHILSEYYLYKGEDYAKALQALDKGIAINNAYCKYLKGTCILNDTLEGFDKKQGIELLEEAYEYGMINAANWLGRYYCYTPDTEHKSIPKSIEWHKKAKHHYNEDSLVELGLIYLYEEEIKDTEQGEIYLNWAIQEGITKGMTEKAHYLLSKKEGEYSEAQKLLEDAMQKEDAYAPYRLGLMYEKGEIGEDPDYYKAFEHYKLSAERGHLYGLELAGHYCRTGITQKEESDSEKAIEFFEKAIKIGSDYARMELGLCYETGFGVEKDYTKAYELYQEAADHNYPYAYNKLGYYEEDGLVGEPNLAKAFEYFQKSEETGSAEGIYNVGRAYRYGIGVQENPEKALEYFNKAAEMDYGDACIELGLAYENEYGGLEFDAPKALDYMTRAAEQGYAYAQYKVGYYYYYGFTEKNMNEALSWLEKSYDRGNPYAALLLGDYYLYNDGGMEEPEYDRAFDYYRMAEAKGIVSEGLGVCYQFGIGTEESAHEAFKSYLKGSEKGYTAAKYRLGMAFKNGTGTEEDLQEAFKWLSKAGEGGNYQAQYHTAMMMMNGEGTEVNLEQGIILLTRLAEENHTEAQFELANCYLMGKGVAEDEVQSMVWYQKAAENGHEQAQKVTGKRGGRR